MKDLTVTLNLNDETWYVGNIEDYNSTTELLFHVIQLDGMDYDNLRFGFNLFHNNVEIQSVSEPPVGTVYISTDQSYLKSIPIRVTFNREYLVKLWVENAGKRYEFDHTFITPKPQQPFPSWVWSDERDCWDPPVFKRADQPNYMWNEDMQQWTPSPNTDISLPEQGVWNPNTNQWEAVPDYDVQ